MKNYIYILGVAALSLGILSCGSVDYPKADKEVAKQACSCFGDLSKESAEINAWYAENSEEIVKVLEQMNDEPDKPVTSELPKQYEDMVESWNQTREAALNVCYEDFLHEKGDYYEDRFHDGDVDSTKKIIVPALAADLCPEVAAPFSSLADVHKGAKDLLPKEE